MRFSISLLAVSSLLPFALGFRSNPAPFNPFSLDGAELIMSKNKPQPRPIKDLNVSVPCYSAYDSNSHFPCWLDQDFTCANDWPHATGNYDMPADIVVRELTESIPAMPDNDTSIEAEDEMNHGSPAAHHQRVRRGRFPAEHMPKAGREEPLKGCCRPTVECHKFAIAYKASPTHTLTDWKKMVCCITDVYEPSEKCPEGNHSWPQVWEINSKGCSNTRIRMTDDMWGPRGEDSPLVSFKNGELIETECHGELVNLCPE